MPMPRGKRAGSKPQRSITTLVASSDRHRPSVRRRNPGHRHHRQSHAQKVPGLQDPFPGDPQRAWQRRANPVRIALLHLVLESRVRLALKAKLEKLTKTDRRTLSAYVEKLLEDHVKSGPQVGSSTETGGAKKRRLGRLRIIQIKGSSHPVQQ